VYERDRCRPSGSRCASIGRVSGIGALMWDGAPHVCGSGGGCAAGGAALGGCARTVLHGGGGGGVSPGKHMLIIALSLIYVVHLIPFGRAPSI